MDPAETMRAALRQQVSARKRYEEAKVQPLSAEESEEQRAAQLDELRAAAETADAEMARLRPQRPNPADSEGETYTPSLSPDLSN